MLDQSLLAGVGNIYASEALFRAGVAPTLPARRLTGAQIKRLWRAVRAVLREAIACGSTVPLNFAGEGARDGLFYFGRAPGAPDYYEERLRVYDRAGQPCPACGTAIRRQVQAARSTFIARVASAAETADWSHLRLPGAVTCGNWRVCAREVDLPAAARVTQQNQAL